MNGEPLFTCPRCQAPNFTRRGLRGHVCRKNGRKPLPKAEVDAAPAQGTSKALVPAGAKPMTLATLDVLPPPGRIDESIAAQVNDAVRLHHETGLSLARGLVASALCGKVLTELKKSVKHGEWLPFIVEFLEPAGLPERTVRQHMEVWQSAKAKALKSANFADLPALMDRRTSELSEEEKESLFKQTRAICAGETARSLLEDYGHVKKGHGHAIRQGNGGFHPNAMILRAWLAENYADQPELQEMDFCDLPKDVQARFKKEGTRYEERLSKEQKAELELAEKARGWNGALAASLLDAIAAGYYARATDEELQAQRDALKDHLAKVEEQLTARAGKRGKALAKR